MLNRWNFHKDHNLYAPITGKCIDITEVNDIAFSSKAMGDGLAIIPNQPLLVSPCNGIVKMIFKTNHAIGIEADNGAEILIHIGIDTVNLNGKGMQALVKKNTKVKKGDPLIHFDLESISLEYDMTIMIIITNGKAFQKVGVHEPVDYGQCILEGQVS